MPGDLMPGVTSTFYPGILGVMVGLGILGITVWSGHTRGVAWRSSGDAVEQEFHCTSRYVGGRWSSLDLI